MADKFEDQLRDMLAILQEQFKRVDVEAISRRRAAEPIEPLAINSAGTAGTYGTLSGCFGSLGSFGSLGATDVTESGSNK